MGSTPVYKIGNRRYETKARDGRGVQRRRRFETRAEAVKSDRQLEAERAETRKLLTIPSGDRTTLAHYMDAYLDSHVAGPATLHALSVRFKLARKTLGPMLLSDLSREHVGHWTRHQLDHLAPTSQRGYPKALRQLLAQAVRDGLIPENPAAAVPMPTQAGPTMKPFRSWKEVEDVAQTLGEYGPMVRFAARTGLRPQEWQALRRADLDLTNGRLTVSQVVRDGRIVPNAAKTKRSHRTIVLSRHALAALEDHGLPSDPDALVFGRNGRPFSLQNFRRPWYAALHALGLQQRGPVQLRHTFATLSLTGNPPVPINLVSRMLGHADISTTLNHYAAYLPELDEQLRRNLDAAP